MGSRERNRFSFLRLRRENNNSNNNNNGNNNRNSNYYHSNSTPINHLNALNLQQYPNPNPQDNAFPYYSPPPPPSQHHHLQSTNTSSSTSSLIAPTTTYPSNPNLRTTPIIKPDRNTSELTLTSRVTSPPPPRNPNASVTQLPDIPYTPQSTSSEQTHELLKLTKHITTQTDQARRLFETKSHLLPVEEHEWVTSTITDTENAARDVRAIVEMARVDQETHGGRMGLGQRIRWTLRDGQRAKERKATLIICHGSLISVISRLQALPQQPQPQPHRRQSQQQQLLEVEEEVEEGKEEEREKEDEEERIDTISMLSRGGVSSSTGSMIGTMMSTETLTKVRSPASIRPMVRGISTSSAGSSNSNANSSANSSANSNANSAWNQRQDPGMEAVVAPMPPPKLPIATSASASSPTTLSSMVFDSDRGSPEKTEPSKIPSELKELLSWRSTHGGSERNFS